jgi:hypothetical protein
MLTDPKFVKFMNRVANIEDLVFNFNGIRSLEADILEAVF